MIASGTPQNWPLLTSRTAGSTSVQTWRSPHQRKVRRVVLWRLSARSVLISATVKWTGALRPIVVSLHSITLFAKLVFPQRPSKDVICTVYVFETKQKPVKIFGRYILIMIFFRPQLSRLLTLSLPAAIGSVHREFWDDSFFFCSPVDLASRPSHTWLRSYLPRSSSSQLYRVASLAMFICASFAPHWEVRCHK